jgi:hypothetical protein
MADSIPAVLNRHERISHFYGWDKRDQNGDLLNDHGRTLLEALDFKTYRELATWLGREFTGKNLDWRKIDAGSPYPISVLVVIAFLEDEKIEKWFISPFVAGWTRLSADKRKCAFRNFKRLFGAPELRSPITKRFQLEYKLFMAILQERGWL